MRKQISVFIVTLLFFATGTSAISYSLAKETYNSAKPQKNSYKVVETKSIPWYCSSIIAKVKAQFADEKSGYYVSGYQPTKPGYVPSPGYQPTKPGYTPTPGYQPPKPGYIPPPGYQPTKPGYITSAEPMRIIDLVSMPAKLQPNEFVSKWQSTLTPCPVSHKFDEELIVKKCSITLQKKLDGNPLPAESREQYQTCAQILAPSVWNAKISQKICTAFYLYEKDCSTSQAARRACMPLSKYLITAGVERSAIPKTQSDTIYLCKDVYPKP
jgi:hypothetical protein